jgi:hypothetical protein
MLLTVRRFLSIIAVSPGGYVVAVVLRSGWVPVAFVFVEARAPDHGTGEPLIRLFSLAYPPDFILGIFPFPSVTNDALDFVFAFGGAVLFFLFTGCWL